MAEENAIILKAITTMENNINIKFIDMEKHLEEKIDSFQKLTNKDIDHINESLESLKKQSREHYEKENLLFGKIGETVVEHAQEDVRHIEEVDIKIDNIGNRINNLERTMSVRVDRIENELIEQRGEQKGKKSVGGSISTWVGFGFMVIMGLLTLGTFIFKGVTP